MTTLIQRMREELVRRNYATTTIHSYLKAVEHFEQRVNTPLDQLGPDDIRSYHAYLLESFSLPINHLRQSHGWIPLPPWYGKGRGVSLCPLRCRPALSHPISISPGFNSLPSSPWSTFPLAFYNRSGKRVNRPWVHSALFLFSETSGPPW